MFFGLGVLRGLMVTLKNFVTSYFMPPDRGGLFTVEYPEKRLPVIERFRNFPFLVYDKDPENPRCVACEICANECPTKCIYIEKDTDPNKKPLRRPAIFDIDITVCMNCGICEEVCPFDSIYMDHPFEVASADRLEKLLFHKNDLLKSNDYFHKIRPTHAAAIDARRRAVEEKKKSAAVKPSETGQPPKAQNGGKP